MIVNKCFPIDPADLSLAAVSRKPQTQITPCADCECLTRLVLTGKVWQSGDRNVKRRSRKILSVSV